MTYPIIAPETEGHNVGVQLAGVVAELRLIVDAVVVAPVAGIYTLPFTSSGKPVVIRFKTPVLDFVPDVTVNDRAVEIAPPLQLWQYLWCGIPAIALVVYGRGLLPSLLGLALSYLSLYQLRAQAPERRNLWPLLTNVIVIGLVAGLLGLGHTAALHRVSLH